MEENVRIQFPEPLRFTRWCQRAVRDAKRARNEVENCDIADDTIAQQAVDENLAMFRDYVAKLTLSFGTAVYPEQIHRVQHVIARVVAWFCDAKTPPIYSDGPNTDSQIRLIICREFGLV